MILRTENFSLKHTVESAQPLTFFGDIKKEGMGVAYTSGGALVEVEQRGRTLSCAAYGALGEKELEREVVERFGLKDDMRRVYKNIDTDRFMHDSIKRYAGMRITKNDPWETTLCFLISQFNNVKRIRGIVKRLVDAYGEPHIFRTESVLLRFKTFPTPEELAGKSTRELMAHGAGFRARYIKETARECADSFELGKLYGKSYAEAKEELMQLKGVGDKVADCILLFGYGKMEAFPIDTWIKRIVEKNYFKARKQSMKKIHEFAERRWDDYAGYAQQYLYHSARNNK